MPDRGPLGRLQSELVAPGLTVESEPGRVVTIRTRGGGATRSTVFGWAERGEIRALINALRRAERNALKEAHDG